MANTDTLLDFGDDSLSPTTAPLSKPEGSLTSTEPTPNGDPFDIFGGPPQNQTSPDHTTSPDLLEDSFDPFDFVRAPKLSEPDSPSGAPEKMENSTGNYDAQFEDLLGDFGGSCTVENGDIGGETITTVTKTTEIQEDGDVMVTKTEAITEMSHDQDANDFPTQDQDGSHEKAFVNTDVYESHQRSESQSSSKEGAPQVEDTIPDYQPPKRYVKKEEKSRSGPSVYITPETESPKSTPKQFKMLGGAGVEHMCKRCNKRVYEMEKIIADKNIYHKICFRCVHCKRILSLTNYAQIDNKPYCKPHFIELFKKKGRYDMGDSPQISHPPNKPPVAPVTPVKKAESQPEPTADANSASDE